MRPDGTTSFPRLQAATDQRRATHLVSFAFDLLFHEYCQTALRRRPNQPAQDLVPRHRPRTVYRRQRAGPMSWMDRGASFSRACNSPFRSSSGCPVTFLPSRCSRSEVGDEVDQIASATLIRSGLQLGKAGGVIRATHTWLVRRGRPTVRKYQRAPVPCLVPVRLVTVAIAVAAAPMAPSPATAIHLNDVR
jgi:hypothetical protein